jgi:thiol-disulfide isomerase/thioredoxin
MKILFASLVLLASGIFAIAQNEQAPIYLKEVELRTGSTPTRVPARISISVITTKGKKLVAVVYYAPWCPNWRHDAPMVEKLYEKYKDKALP